MHLRICLGCVFFDSFAGLTAVTEETKGCEQTSTPENVFWFYLEDYLEGNDRYGELWDFLE